MPQHMVIFQNPDGDTGYNQFDSIEEAVAFVEKIRNEQGIDSIRIFELEEVKFDLKPYYRVELQALKPGSPSTPSSAPSAPASGQSPSSPSSPPPPSTESAPAPESPTSTSPFAPPSESGAPAYQAPGGSGPVPPADQPEEEQQPTRRGLFGR